jgi:hypothetical protein
MSNNKIKIKVNHLYLIKIIFSQIVMKNCQIRRKIKIVFNLQIENKKYNLIT